MKFRSLVPELLVSDFSESIDFYTRALPFRIEYSRKGPDFAFLSLGDAQIMIQQRNGKWETGNLEKPFGRGINLQIEVDSVQRLVSSLEKNGHKLFLPPRKNEYKAGEKTVVCRELLVQDPDGYLLRFSEII